MGLLSPNPRNAFSMAGPFGALATAMAEAIKAEICAPGTSMVAPRPYDHSLGTALEDAVLQTWVSCLVAEDAQGEQLRETLARYMASPAALVSQMPDFDLPLETASAVQEVLPVLGEAPVEPSDASSELQQPDLFDQPAAEEGAPVAVTEEAIESPVPADEVVQPAVAAPANRPDELSFDEPVAGPERVEQEVAEPEGVAETPAEHAEVAAITVDQPAGPFAAASASAAAPTGVAAPAPASELLVEAALAHPSEPPAQVTGSVAAQRLGVSVPYIRMLARLGKLEVVEGSPDSELQVSVDSLEAYAAAQAARPHRKRA